MSRKGYCLELGREEYGEILALQKVLNQARRNGVIADTVIFLEHHPCFTIGRSGGFDHILVSQAFLEEQGIKVYETDRGGDITYHGPGQLVCYPILDLTGFERDVHLYARRMEEILIRTLKSFGIAAGRKQAYPGVWAGSAKIAAEGMAVQHWVTMHGVALNIFPDLNHFSYIIPCGISASTLGVTSMEKVLGHTVDFNQVKLEMRQQLSDVMDLYLEDVTLAKVKDMLEGV
ncbi:lipoyl(octanoyl) transferase LipB [Desulfosporosinus sp. FKB]|uniref:lipoyl(octanoyl) transferase LipB n=1 Tax=Desulfosporosinus sp. FKB TaxID=1969835 RepID=UPI000B499016|nr:lipoyl(octanoyl) transferase LipB [Desulfosporosinus sp. FKB]